MISEVACQTSLIQTDNPRDHMLQEQREMTRAYSIYSQLSRARNLYPSTFHYVVTFKTEEVTVIKIYNVDGSRQMAHSERKRKSLWSLVAAILETRMINDLRPRSPLSLSVSSEIHNVVKNVLHRKVEKTLKRYHTNAFVLS